VDETAELFGLCGPALTVLFGAAEGFEFQQSVGTVLCLTGERLADFNLMLLTSDPDAPLRLRRAVARASLRNLPLLVVMSPRVADELASVAASFDLTPAGTIPLMVLRGAPKRGSKQAAMTLKHATTAPERQRVGALISAAFDLPGEAVDRVLVASLQAPIGAEAYLGLQGNDDLSSVSVTINGDTAGIWSMATPPHHQGRGLGRGLLLQVIEGLRKRGVKRFFLFASAAGLKLYESLGFQTISECTVWVRSPAKGPSRI
jgi:GNAT superfamily N-acetyltransferase